jgi:colanic acid biosynthesis glycosyl transferase WcaI
VPTEDASLGRALVVGINYAPEHTGIAPYTTQACEHLARSGVEVLGLVGVPHYPQWAVEAPYRSRLRSHERVEGVVLRRLRHTVPSQQTARRRATYEATFGLHVLSQRLPWRPDVVLTVVPSLLGAAAAARLAARSGAPLVVWVQDLMGPAAEQSGIAGGGRVAATTSRLERWVLRRADAVVLVSPAFRPYVEAAGVPAGRIDLVPNWSHIGPADGDRQVVRRRLGWRDGETIALHSGNMGLKQGLENVVEAASRAPEGIRFVLMGDGSQRDALRERGRDLPRLSFLPPATTEDFPRVLAAADVLLVNERASAVDMSLPSKLTSYLAAGQPVVAAVPDGGGTAAEVRRSGAGVVVRPEEPDVLLEAVARLAADPARRRALGSAGLSHAQQHLSREAALARLTGVLVEAAASRRA